MKKLYFIPVLFYALLSCNTNKEEVKGFKKNIPENPVFQLLNTETTGINFVNQIKNETDFNIFRYRNFYNGGGVGIADINNDGLEDIYFVSNQGQNKLYLNKGNFQFEDITERAGVAGSKAWSTGVVFVDINADGFMDIYVCNAGNEKGDDRRNELFINQGDLTFKEDAASYQLDDDGFTTHAAFFDYDNDGDLDVYILNNSFIPVSSLGYNNKRELRAEDWNVPNQMKAGGDKLLQNNNGIFTDVSESAGIFGSLIGFGLGVTVGDVNNDGWLDLYISNDFYERDYLYINQGNGTFNEEITQRTKHFSLSSMGADMADINNDGAYEIFSTDMLPETDERLKTTTQFESFDVLQLKKSLGFYHQYMQNALQLNNGNGYFKEVALFSGVAKTDWSWGALFFDMDNNGYKDLYVCNGIKQDLTNQDFIDFFADEVYQRMAISGKKTAQDTIISIMPSTPVANYGFVNNANLTFSNKTFDLGFDIESFSNGAAYADLNNDGNLDLVVNNIDQPAFIFKNTTTHNNYLKVKLQYQKPNNFAIGARVNAYVNGKVLSNELIPSRGFQSSVSYTMQFGLGTATSVDSLHVIWPNKTFQRLVTLKANQTLNIEYNSSEAINYNFDKNNKTQTIFKKVETDINPHVEDFYVDFDYEGLIFKMQSREGPCLCAGATDASGNPILFMGGAKDQEAQFFGSTGKMLNIGNNQDWLKAFAKFEDTACAFADIDGDGDLDLIIASGGNTKPNASADRYTIRILKNKGNGSFEVFQTINNPYNTSTIKTFDFNQDGHQDLFIGNFSVPGVYGVKPKSKLFENDGNGNFVDVTEQKAFDFKNLGMVKDAIWYDFDNDGLNDLIVVGEWMPPMFFKNNQGNLESFQTNLDEYSGLYNAIYATDLNNNGKKELVFGNYGKNFKLQPSLSNPVKMFVNDFDDNGTIEQIITRHFDNNDKPFISKRDLSAQIPLIKKDNISYNSYASKSIIDLFGNDKIAQSIQYNLTELASFVAFAKAPNNYEIIYLPTEIQLSSVNAITSVYLDDLEKKALIFGGNFYHFKPQYATLDASEGQVVIYQDDVFQIIKNLGLHVEGEVRALQTITNKLGEKYIVVARNNQTPIIFRYEP